MLNPYDKKKNWVTVFSALLIILFILSLPCAFAESETALSDDYVIGPGDVLDIKVAKDDNLTRVVAVDKDGIIILPYLKEVKIAGLTPKSAAELIATRLKNEGYLLEPEVSVLVKEYHSQKVMVFGLVKNPGTYILKGKTQVLDLLSQIENTEEGGTMTIIRKDPSGNDETINVDLHALIMNGDLTQNIQVLSGDHIIISRKSTRQQIYILGEVKSPGPYTVERDITVLEAIKMAGGFTDFANRNKIKIIREENGEKKNIMINLSKISKGDKSQDIILKAGDVLVALKSWF